MYNIATQRLLLRPMTATDAQDIGEMYSNQAANAHYLVELLNTFPQKLTFTNRLISESNAIWTIRLLSQPEKIIGDCALHHHNPVQKSLEIGGTLVPEYWGKGMMAEAFLVIMQYASNTYEVNCFVAKTTKQNSRAIRFAQKAGFVAQGKNEEELVMIKRVDE